MSWTETELAELRRAYASGTLRVSYDGKSVEYGSAADLLARIRTIEAEIARRSLNPVDPVAAVNRIPFSEPDHPFSLQVMYAENPPFQLDPAHRPRPFPAPGLDARDEAGRQHRPSRAQPLGRAHLHHRTGPE